MVIPVVLKLKVVDKELQLRHVLSPSQIRVGKLSVIVPIHCHPYRLKDGLLRHKPLNVRVIDVG